MKSNRILKATILGLLVQIAPTLCGQSQGPRDLKAVSLEELGIKPVLPQKDVKTGFVVGGKNATPLINGLKEINGRSIAELEQDMRPGAKSKVGSQKGFLGTDERLLNVLAEDNKYVVEELGLTHQELAKHLHVMGVLAFKEKGGAILYHGRRFKATGIASCGYQFSPFYDGTKTNSQAVIQNLDTGKEIAYSLLVPHMIERYGFYEGKGTPYRVEPRQVMEVFDFLKEKIKKP
jgi:hypothetical protein